VSRNHRPFTRKTRGSLVEGAPSSNAIQSNPGASIPLESSFTNFHCTRPALDGWPCFHLRRWNAAGAVRRPSRKWMWQCWRFLGSTRRATQSHIGRGRYSAEKMADSSIFSSNKQRLPSANVQGCLFGKVTAAAISVQFGRASLFVYGIGYL